MFFWVLNNYSRFKEKPQEKRLIQSWWLSLVIFGRITWGG
jgi:hypothetical protein